MRTATARDELAEKELQKEMDQRRLHTMKIKKFICIMSGVSNLINLSENDKKKKLLCLTSYNVTGTI